MSSYSYAPLGYPFSYRCRHKLCQCTEGLPPKQLKGFERVELVPSSLCADVRIPSSLWAGVRIPSSLCADVRIPFIVGFSALDRERWDVEVYGGARIFTSTPLGGGCQFEFGGCHFLDNPNPKP
jgi:hypothetical protein